MQTLTFSLGHRGQARVLAMAESIIQSNRVDNGICADLQSVRAPMKDGMSMFSSDPFICWSLHLNVGLGSLPNQFAVSTGFYTSTTLIDQSVIVFLFSHFNRLSTDHRKRHNTTFMLRLFRKTRSVISGEECFIFNGNPCVQLFSLLNTRFLICLVSSFFKLTTKI